MQQSGSSQRQAFRLEVNAAVIVRLEEFKRQLSLMLMDLSESGCRMRAGVSLPANTKLSFSWLGPSREPLRLSGSIVSAKRIDAKTAEYGIRFEMAVNDRDRLAHELLEVQRRKNFRSAAPDAAPEVADGNLGGSAKRQAYRVPVQFPITIRARSSEGVVTQFRGDANDLSVGGLMLLAPQDFAEDTQLTLRFTLPIGAVDLGGEQKEEIEVTPFGERRTKKIIPVRPFEPIEANAKVAKAIGVKLGKFAFGIAFLQIEPYAREEIARFIHAYQLTQLRRSAAKS